MLEKRLPPLAAGAGASDGCPTAPDQDHTIRTIVLRWTDAVVIAQRVHVPGG